MVEIYIKGKIVDLSEDKGIQFSVKSNFMGALDDLSASRTYTLTLPSTRNNMSIIGLANDIASNSSFRHKKFPAEILLDGFQITTSATAYLTSVKENSFDIIISWNTSNTFTKFSDDKLTDIIINRHDLYDYLIYDSSMTFDKPVSEIADMKGYFWYNNRLPDTDNATVRYHHPCVSAAYILDKIMEAYGVTILGINPNDYNSYLFPLVTNKTSNEGLEWQGLTSSDPRINTVFPCRLFPALSNFKQMIDVFHPQSFEDSFYRNEYAESFRFQCHIVCTAPNFIIFSDYTTGDIGDTIIKINTDENNEFNIDEEIKYQGDFIIHFYSGDSVNISAEGTYFKVTPLYDKSLFYDGSDRYGRFDIMSNLPDMKVSEFIADFCALIGAFPIGNGSELYLMPYSQFLDKTNAIDWSDKFVSIKDVEYSHDKSAKEITFGFKNDDDYSFDGSAVVHIDSDIVDDKSNFFDSVLTNMDGYRLQLYSKSFDNNNVAVFELNDIDPKIGYKTTVDGVKLGCSGISEQIIFKPYAGLFGLLATKYQEVVNVLQDYQMITANMLLKPYDIYNFGLGKPVYIAKLGSYFAVTSIEYDTSNEVSEVEMIKLN